MSNEPLDNTCNNEEDELKAEQESAAAMDAEVMHGDVPEPPEAGKTTEGQPT